MSELSLYDSWVEDVYGGDVKERERLVNDAIDRASSASPAVAKLLESFNDDNEFKKPCTLAFQFYVPMDEKKDGYVRHKSFSAPLVVKTHKRLPITIGIGDKIGGRESWKRIPEIQQAMNVKQVLGYVDRLSRMSTPAKKELLEKTFEALESYRDKKEAAASIKKMKDPNAEKVWLSDVLRSGKEFKLNGFSVNYPYINLDKKYGDTKPFWVHPWGPGQLLYSHRTSPIIIIAGPYQREDENILGERNMIGKTG